MKKRTEPSRRVQSKRAKRRIMHRVKVGVWNAMPEHAAGLRLRNARNQRAAAEFKATGTAKYVKKWRGKIPKTPETRRKVLEARTIARRINRAARGWLRLL
jgi:hypothetical protein